MKVSLVQLNSRDDKAANLSAAETAIRNAVATDAPRLVVLPECYDYLGGTEDGAFAAAETFPDGESYRLMQRLARELDIYVHAGSVMERDGESTYNSTVVFDPKGGEIARYRKIHLFDIDAPDGKSYKESRLYRAGDCCVTYLLDGVRVGCSTCYDIRFPELYQQLVKAGAEIVAIPSAFTLQTGKDHWEILCRSRAIETQTYVLAAGMYGPYLDHGEERVKYGNSMIVGPWGTVIARAEDRVGHITGSLDLNYVRRVREMIPVQQHRVL